MNTEILTFLRKDLGMETVDAAEVVENMREEEAGFVVEGYRFILEDEIDEIQQEELKSDLYVLGCFYPGFLSDVLDLDSDVIETMQKAETFEAIGKLIIFLDKLEELQQEYSRIDGYGHHFARYDGGEQSIGNYYVFKVDG